jgi:hypothetical protein
MRKEVHLEEIEFGGQILSKHILKFLWEEVKWIGFFQDGDIGFAFVNIVMNIWFQKLEKEVFDYMRK